MTHCAVVEVRNLEDAVGYACSRTASKHCSDCGAELCESHAETCGGCHAIFCPTCRFLHRAQHSKPAHGERRERKRLAHRIRYTMAQEPLLSKLDGIIEIDETYVGGKLRIGPQSIKPGQRPNDRPAPSSNKAAVLSVLLPDAKSRSDIGMRHTSHADRCSVSRALLCNGTESRSASYAHAGGRDPAVRTEHHRLWHWSLSRRPGKRLAATNSGRPVHSLGDAFDSNDLVHCGLVLLDGEPNTKSGSREGRRHKSAAD